MLARGADPALRRPVPGCRTGARGTGHQRGIGGPALVRLGHTAGRDGRRAARVDQSRPDAPPTVSGVLAAIDDWPVGSAAAAVVGPSGVLETHGPADRRVPLAARATPPAALVMLGAGRGEAG